VFTIKEGELKEEERAPEVKIKTKVFKAVPVKNAVEESMFIITTARRSNIEVSYNCSECGKRVTKQELKTCPGCGLDFCSQCLAEHDCEEEYDED
jgi:rRNA maturation endonuclease Nob1